MKKGLYKKMIDRLLRTVEVLTEFKTGRRAYAQYQGTISLKIWYTKKEEENGTVETYYLPFTRVQIFTPINFS